MFGTSTFAQHVYIIRKQQHNISLLDLLETHLQESDNVAFLWHHGSNWEGCFTRARGRAGGILVAWRSGKLRPSLVFSCDQSINLLVKKQGKST